MSPYEFFTVCVSLVAIVISFVSLIRTRETSNKQIELEKISAKLAEKQLTKIEETEEREGQPIFVVRATNIVGADPEQTGYKVKVTIFVENTGQDYLEPKGLDLVSLKDGIWKHCPKASLDYIDIREHDLILGEHSMTLNPGCNLHNCVILISYVDNVGMERIQEYEIFPEGSLAELPFRVFFTYKKTYRLVPSVLWKG